MEWLDSTPFRLLEHTEAWECDGLRRAAINNFGFGGNNAHLLVEEWVEQPMAAAPPAPRKPAGVEIAIVAASAMVSRHEDLDALRRHLFFEPGKQSALSIEAMDEIAFDITQLRFPPNDLEHTLPQQLLALKVAMQLKDKIDELPGQTTGIYMGMQCDTEIARYGARWRMANLDVADEAIAAERDQIMQSLEAAGVLGTMPNIVANRMNSQFNLLGPSYTVSAEEASGLVAVKLAARALAHGELDAALVGAVDLCADPVHEAAAREVLPEAHQTGGDAGILLVLKRLEDARRDGDEVLAVLSDGPMTPDESPMLHLGDGHPAAIDLATRFGHAHAASGLLHLLVGALCARHGAILHQDASQAASPVLTPGRELVHVSAKPLFGEPVSMTLRGVEQSSAMPESSAFERLHLFSANELYDLKEALSSNELSWTGGEVRLAIVASKDDYEARKKQALELLDTPGNIAIESPSVELAPGIFLNLSSRREELGRITVLVQPPPRQPWRALLFAKPSLATRALQDAGEDISAERVAALYDGSMGDAGHEQLAATWSERLLSTFFTSTLSLDLDELIVQRSQDSAPVAHTILLDERADGVDALSATLARLFVLGCNGDWQRWPQTAQPTSQEATRRAICKSYPAHMKPVHIARDPMTNVQKSSSAHASIESQSHQVSVASSQTTRVGEDVTRLPLAPRLPEVLADTSARTLTSRDEQTSYALDPPRRLARPVRAHVTSAATHHEHPSSSSSSTTSHSSTVKEQAVKPHTSKSPASSLRAASETSESTTSQNRESAHQGGEQPSDVVARHFEMLSSLHQQFLAQQADIQRHFIEARARQIERLATSTTASPTTPPSSPTTDKPVTLPITTGFSASALTQVASATTLLSGVVHANTSANRHDDVALSRPLFAPSSAAAPLADAGGALPALTPPSTGIETRAKSTPAAPATTSQPKVDKPLAQKVISSGASTVAPAAAPPKKSFKAPKGASANLQRHHIIPSADKPKPIGPTFDYDQIAIHASGKISEIFGEPFGMQDDWRVQVRMPEPPLLLCHRVTGIDCEKGQVGTGTLWCESDIPEDAWYLHQGRMPVGIMIESGQADLMLISYMGADFENKGERVYRLLGCELMFHGGLAKPGDVLAYDIHIDGHARQDAIRLFFFHYDLEIDGQVRLSVRNGQAGFFSYEELAESNGILWTPEDEDRDAIMAAPFDAHPRITPKRSFSAQEVQQFSEGRGYDVFGKGFEKIAAHTRTPRIQSDKMRFMDEVVEFDPTGGPWGRGYLKATQSIDNKNWFFDGHFLNDPCMPGTLMFEGCVQVMAFYMAACGWTVERDGWIFEPVPFEAYPLRCRGQVAPGAKEVVYEVLVREVHDGEIPKLYADLMCTVDGLKAFHCGRMGLQLTPAWPLESQDALLTDHVEPKPVATAHDGHKFGYDSLLACAWGKPTRAFGSMYAPFDSHRKVARLPGPPYHFISRVTEIDPDAQNAMKSGCAITVEYDVPEDAWYFRENGAAVMPYAVLLEAALQPCGWLASYVGCALTRDDVDLAFRNLDGTTTQFIEVTPETGTLETSTRLTNIARAGGNIIVSFLVETRELSSGRVVLTMDTVFGFFPPDSLANQVGLPIKEEHRAMFDAPLLEGGAIDLTARPERYCARPGRLAEPMLLMLDRVTAAQPSGGSRELGFYRAEKDVDPHEWFFKAHFFQDPVQPGSLGLEALLQLLQFAMLHKGLDESIENPRFEALALDEPISWKYRGQVLTHNDTITSTLEIKEIREEQGAILAIAEGSLWVDGMRIYHSTNVGMRLVSGQSGPLLTAETEDYVLEQLSEVSVADEGQEAPSKKPEGVSSAQPVDLLIDPRQESWLLDHCPTYTAPALPMMSIIDLLVQHARHIGGPERVVASLEHVKLKKWVIFHDLEARRLRTYFVPETQEVVLDLWWDAPNPKLSRYDEVARGHVTFASGWSDLTPPALFEPLEAPINVMNPYASGELFHGPDFQLLTQLKRDEIGASASLDLARNGVPRGAVEPGVLDAALQIIPHDAIERWHHEHPGDVIAYPHEIESIRFFEATPEAGVLKSEVRFVSGTEHTITCDVQVARAGESRPWMAMRLTEILFPKGPLGRMNGRDRQSFLRDCQFTPGASLSTHDGTHTSCTLQNVLESNWFKGTLETIYNVSGSPSDLARDIAIKEHVATGLAVHPGALAIDHARQRVSFRGAPLCGVAYLAAFDDASQSWSVSTPLALEEEGQLPFDLEHVSSWWSSRLGVPSSWLGGDLYRGLIERFVAGVEFEDLFAMRAIEGRNVLFLGNHEVQIESLLVTILGSVLVDGIVITMANAKHERGWVGSLIRDLFSYPGCEDPSNIVYFDQKDPASMFDLIEHFKHEVRRRDASVMVHAPGTRARSAGEPVERISSALIDMALELGLVIVPVNFSGGLPNEPVSEDKIEFPISQTGQIYRFGAPIMPDYLESLPYGERRRAVLEAINRIAPSQAKPNEPRLDLQQEIDAWMASPHDLDEINATLLSVLRHLDSPRGDVRTLLEALQNEAPISSEEDAALRDWLEAFRHRFDRKS